MLSIVVPAHNESAVIARTLSQWVATPATDDIGVIVVCNGCTDDTADVARGFGPTVRVVESDVPSKTHALNLGDQSSDVFPRIYVDADIVITIDAIRALARRLSQGDALAVAPAADIDLTACSWPVRKYYGVRSRLPSSHEGIGGSGVYALSESGRRRFGEFPDIIADDTYVRLQFRPDERETLPGVRCTVFPPRNVRRLIAVRTRVYRGTFELVSRFPELVVNKAEANHRTLVALFKEPRLWPELLTYCFVNFVAQCRARLGRRTKVRWLRDDTSRAALSADSPK